MRDHLSQLHLPPRPRILLVNHWHDDNKGDGAISASTVSLLKEIYPGARISVVGLLEGHGGGSESAFRHLLETHPEVSAEGAWLPSEHSTRIRWPSLRGSRGTLVWLARCLPWALSFVSGVSPPSIRRRLGSVDLMVAMGGSNIYDDPAVFALPSLARLLSVLYIVAAAGRAGIPVVGLGHTIGPFPRSSGRWMVRRALRPAQLISARDPRSAEVGNQLRLRVELAPDAAFALSPAVTPRVNRVMSKWPTPMNRSLLVLPRQHPSAGQQADLRFLRELAETCRGLVLSGAVDQVVVGAHGQGPTPIEDDRKSVAALLPLLDGIPWVVLDEDLSPCELAHLYGQARATISVRLHGSILAMVGGSPSFTVSYFSTKAEGVMADAGQPQAWVDYKDFDSRSVLPIVEQLMSDPTREALSERMTELRSRLQRWPDTSEVAA